MKKNEAIQIAKMFKNHAEKRKKSRDAGDRAGESFHEGCMKTALQILEEFSSSHGFGSPDHALGTLEQKSEVIESSH